MSDGVRDPAGTGQPPAEPGGPALEAAMEPPTRRAWQVTGVAVAVVCLIGAALAAGFVAFARNAAEAAAPPDPRADGIVVLTGGSARIDNGLKLLAEGRGARLLISGVNPVVSEEALASAFGTEFDAALACCVDLGRTARDTIGNAEETRMWAERQRFASLLVVTNAYHMQRSMAELADAMPDIELLAVPIASPDLRLADWWKEPRTFGLLAREYGKYLASLARLTLSPQVAPAAATDFGTR